MDYHPNPITQIENIRIEELETKLAIVAAIGEEAIVLYGLNGSVVTHRVNCLPENILRELNPGAQIRLSTWVEASPTLKAGRRVEEFLLDQ